MYSFSDDYFGVLLTALLLSFFRDIRAKVGLRCTIELESLPRSMFWKLDLLLFRSFSNFSIRLFYFSKMLSSFDWSLNCILDLTWWAVTFLSLWLGVLILSCVPRLLIDKLIGGEIWLSFVVSNFKVFDWGRLSFLVPN